MSANKNLALVACAAFLTLIIAGVTGCGSPTTPPPTTSKTFTSTSVNAHSHTVTIAKADVETPPAAGIALTTSSSVGHTHSFNMTQAQLMTVNGGTAVTQTTGPADIGGVHSHDFTISRWF
jgi:hypothetical protein